MEEKRRRSRVLMILFIFTLIGLGTVYLKYYPEIKEGLEMQAEAALLIDKFDFAGFEHTKYHKQGWRGELIYIIILGEINTGIQQSKRLLEQNKVAWLLFKDETQKEIEGSIAYEKELLMGICLDPETSVGFHKLAHIFLKDDKCKDPDRENFLPRKDSSTKKKIEAKEKDNKSSIDPGDVVCLLAPAIFASSCSPQLNK